MLPVQILGAALPSTALDAIFTAFGSATYANGSPRTPGTGSAWSMSRYQLAAVTEAVYGAPPFASGLNSKVIVAGKATTAAPQMDTGETWSTSALLISYAKNAGAFATWDGANPFTSGQFHGYRKLTPASLLAIGTKIRCFESTEAIGIFAETAAGAIYGGFSNALWDPETTDLVSDAESDGRQYGMVLSGSSTAINATFNSDSGNANSFMGSQSGAGDGARYCGGFTPGGSSKDKWYRFFGAVGGTSPTTLRSRSGKYYRVPLVYIQQGGAPNDRGIGRLREIEVFADSKMGATWSDLGVDLGYVVSGSSGVDQDAVVLKA